MSTKSVVFIEPAAGLTNVFENYMRLPLMGALYLGSILKQAGHEVRLYNEPLMGHAVDPFRLEADVFCLSGLTVSSGRCKQLAAQLRQVHPEAKIMIGGTHASLSPDEYAGLADHLVVGEAEEIIVDLVEGNIDEPLVHGTRVKNLDALPFIDYSLLEGYEKMDIIPMISSRGCPFDCNFCTVTRIFGRKYRMVEPERVIAEIEHALSYFETRDIFFYDDNLAANKQRIHRLCELMIEKNLRLNWTAQVRSDLARDPELVAKMARAGCRWVYVGFESIDNATLKAMHKAQTREHIEHAIRTFHEHGINVHGMFIFGEDHDTPESIAATTDFAIDHRVDSVQFMILTPFPGTETYAQIEGQGRLLHTNWDYYNAMFAVFQPKNMGPATLQQLTYDAYQRFYSLKRTGAGLLGMTADVLLNALVWNFDYARRFNYSTMFMRAAARALIHKQAEPHESYLHFLEELESDTRRATGRL